MEEAGNQLFRMWGIDHWAALILTAVLGGILILNAKSIRAWGNDRIFRYVLAIALVGNELASFFYFLHQGVLLLPLQLCDLAVILMALALIIRNRVVGELAFYWGLAGCSQAVLTPILVMAFPHVTYFQFFFSHGAVILGAVYIAIRGRVLFTAFSIFRVWVAINIYAGIVGLVNWRLGTNYGFLAAKPDRPSILDFFGPWPYYIIGEEFLAIAIFALCYGFGRFLEFVSKKKEACCDR